ncbi:TIM barrel protein [Clostridium septicum]|uniref:AP endonuclease n=1 Tax=Clostridium septicum TaxID=1504 RepID=A0A9N7PJK2_CLOSE|nr:TIM barrel protein [Clostridium septicum]AYE32952.1 AP endonuclease [Clostridium septicum]UEC19533.1 TIM barrel protein [Clostridium septicum]USS02406.1 TIM barrel protein [Clostridium septicum]
MGNLLFGISGLPIGEDDKFTYPTGIEYLHSIGLDAMELPFVRSVNVTPKNRPSILEAKEKFDFYLSAHGSYFINLNAEVEEKRKKSIERILQGSEALRSIGGKSLVFHPGFYLKSSKEEALEEIKKNILTLPNNIDYRLETTGKPTQFGDIDELINICSEIPYCKLCIDFSHIHARENGKLKEYSDFARILDKVGEGLGKDTLSDLHIHLSGIEYSPKGEKYNLPFEESDFNYKDCLKALINYNIKGCLICESPILEHDALLLKNTYESM